jgi:RHS repeat-associated protein
VQSWIDAEAYDVRGDIDLDGDVDATDKATIQAEYTGKEMGRAALSSTAVRNARGQAGYEFVSALEKTYHVRKRHLDGMLGRWRSRDPAEPRPPPNLYRYGKGSPLLERDPSGAVETSEFKDWSLAPGQTADSQTTLLVGLRGRRCANSRPIVFV